MRGALKAIVDDFAASILNALASERGVTIEDIQRSRSINHTKARAAGIRALDAAGFSASEIARQMQIERATAVYWLREADRNRRRVAAAVRYEARV